MMASVRLTRLVAWVALGCHVLVASGLPLPLVAPVRGRGATAGRAGKDRSRPFPCMDKPCGCATAEQCYANCCCHTPAERLAWARAHGVEPTVLAVLERRAGAASTPAAGCCSTSRGEATSREAAMRAAVDPDAPEVCGEYRWLAAAPAPEPAADHERAADTDGVRVVILRDMLACGGILTAWLACGLALPPPSRVALPTSDAPAGDLVLDDDVAPSISADPSAPPPRVG